MALPKYQQYSPIYLLVIFEASLCLMFKDCSYKRVSVCVCVCVREREREREGERERERERETDREREGVHFTCIIHYSG